MTTRFILLPLLLGILVGACGDSPSRPTPDTGATDAAPTDAGATDAGPTDAGAIACGAMTCGPGEYCFIECLCCGVADAGPPAARTECRPLPAGCRAEALCTCPEITGLGGFCDLPTRSVERPCA